MQVGESFDSLALVQQLAAASPSSQQRLHSSRLHTTMSAVSATDLQSYSKAVRELTNTVQQAYAAQFSAMLGAQARDGARIDELQQRVLELELQNGELKAAAGGGGGRGSRAHIESRADELQALHERLRAKRDEADGHSRRELTKTWSGLEEMGRIMEGVSSSTIRQDVASLRRLRDAQEEEGGGEGELTVQEELQAQQHEASFAIDETMGELRASMAAERSPQAEPSSKLGRMLESLDEEMAETRASIGRCEQELHVAKQKALIERAKSQAEAAAARKAQRTLYRKETELLAIRARAAEESRQYAVSPGDKAAKRAAETALAEREGQVKALRSTASAHARVLAQKAQESTSEARKVENHVLTLHEGIDYLKSELAKKAAQRVSSAVCCPLSCCPAVLLSCCPAVVRCRLHALTFE